MLDLKYVVDNIDAVYAKLSQRNGDFSYIYELVDLSNKKSSLLLNQKKLYVMKRLKKLVN
jgi:seryl-tRNA synthetase